MESTEAATDAEIEDLCEKLSTPQSEVRRPSKRREGIYYRDGDTDEDPGEHFKLNREADRDLQAVEKIASVEANLQEKTTQEKTTEDQVRLLSFAVAAQQQEMAAMRKAGEQTQALMQQLLLQLQAQTDTANTTEPTNDQTTQPTTDYRLPTSTTDN